MVWRHKTTLQRQDETKWENKKELSTCWQQNIHKIGLKLFLKYCMKIKVPAHPNKANIKWQQKWPQTVQHSCVLRSTLSPVTASIFKWIKAQNHHSQGILFSAFHFLLIFKENQLCLGRQQHSQKINIHRAAVTLCVCAWVRSESGVINIY